MNKRKKISLISSLFLLGSITTPILLTSCKNVQNYLDGSVLDNGNNNATNNKYNKLGNLSEDLKKLENENVKVHSMNVSNNITIKDYEKESKENNKTLFIHERGNLLEKKLQTAIKQNKDDFIKEFDFKSYVNNLPNDQKQILNPSNESFLKDLQSFIIFLFYENSQFFDVKLKNTNLDSIVDYDKNNNTISFDIAFILKNVSNNSQTFKYLNASHEMLPNNDVEFSLSVKNATITNVVNFVSNRYLLGWEAKNVNFKIGSTNGIFESFVPTRKLVSHAYNMEFFNLSNDISDYTQANNGSEEFIKKLTPKLIKEQLNENVLNNQNIVFDNFQDFANVFAILEKNLTFGKTIAELSNPLSSMLKKFNVASSL